MSRWLVSAKVTISLSTVVRALTARQAIEIAIEEERRVQGLQSDQGDQDLEWVHSGEIDGEPKDLTAREIP